MRGAMGMAEVRGVRCALAAVSCVKRKLRASPSAPHTEKKPLIMHMKKSMIKYGHNVTKDSREGPQRVRFQLRTSHRTPYTIRLAYTVAARLFSLDSCIARSVASTSHYPSRASAGEGGEVRCHSTALVQGLPPAELAL